MASSCASESVAKSKHLGKPQVRWFPMLCIQDLMRPKRQSTVANPRGPVSASDLFSNPRTHEKVFEICNVYIKDENFNSLQTNPTNLSVNKTIKLVCR